MCKFIAILFCTTLISCASTQVNKSTDQTVYQLNQVDAPTKWIVHISPKYPKKAAEEKVEGWAKMSAVISENGRVTNINVLDSQPEGIFESEAKRAFSKWLYKPALLNGKTVKTYREEIVEFKI
jgi:protein TonB